MLLELYLSGEFAYSLEKIRQVGMVRQMDFHSRTSQYGSITRGIRYLGLDAALKTKMGEILDEIRSGRFAKEWTAEAGAGGRALREGPQGAREASAHAMGRSRPRGLRDRRRVRGRVTGGLR